MWNQQLGWKTVFEYQYEIQLYVTSLLETQKSSLNLFLSSKLK